jgi:putative ABC transport system ATP-binding protein
MSTPALELVNVSKKFNNTAGSTQALDDINMKLPLGGVYGLMGPNGSGKTTLMRISSGLMPPDKGIVKIMGVNVYKRGNPVKERVGFMFQDDLLIPTLNLYENVELPLIIQRKPRQMREKIDNTLLEEVGIGKLAQRKPDEVSGGERRRVNLSRALVNKPDLLFLDEPTSNLDTESAENLMDLIRRLNREKVTILMSTHDRYAAEKIENIIYIRDGKLREP